MRLALCKSFLLVAIVILSFKISEGFPETLEISKFSAAYERLMVFPRFKNVSSTSAIYAYASSQMIILEAKVFEAALKKCLSGNEQLIEKEVMDILIGTLSYRLVPTSKDLLRFYYYLLVRFDASLRDYFLTFPKYCQDIKDMLPEGETVFVRPTKMLLSSTEILDVLNIEDLEFFSAAYMFNLTAGFGKIVEWKRKQDGKPIRVNILQPAPLDMYGGLSGIHKLALTSLKSMITAESNESKKRDITGVHDAMKHSSDLLESAVKSLTNFSLVIPYTDFPFVQGYYEAYTKRDPCPLLIIVPGHIFGAVFSGDDLYIRDASQSYVGTVIHFRSKAPGKKLTSFQFSKIMAGYLAPGVISVYFNQVEVRDESNWNSYPQSSGLCSWVSFTGSIKIIFNLKGLSHLDYEEFMKTTRRLSLEEMLKKMKPRHYHLVNELINAAILRSPRRRTELTSDTQTLKRAQYLPDSYSCSWIGEVSRNYRNICSEIPSTVRNYSSSATLAKMRKKFEHPHPEHVKVCAEHTFSLFEGKFQFNNDIESGIFWIISHFGSLPQCKDYPKLSFAEHIYPIYEKMSFEEKQKIIRKHRADELSSLMHKISTFKPSITCRQVEMLYDLSFSSIPDFYKNETFLVPGFTIDDTKELTNRGLFLAGLMATSKSTPNPTIIVYALSNLSKMQFSIAADRALAEEIFLRLCNPILCHAYKIKTGVMRFPLEENGIMISIFPPIFYFYAAYRTTRAINAVLDGGCRADSEMLLKDLRFTAYNVIYFILHLLIFCPIFLFTILALLGFSLTALAVYFYMRRQKSLASRQAKAADLARTLPKTQ